MVALSELSERQRDLAQRRFEVLRPHIEDGVALADAAAAAAIPARTARHWLARFQAGGLPGLARAPRRDRDTRRQPAELVALVEGLALRRPRSSMAHIHRQAVRVANERGWRAPSYGTVRSIVVALDPGLVALAHDGPAAYRDHCELVFRRAAAAANAIWQADHTQLDVMILDQAGRPVRPWPRRFSMTSAVRSPATPSTSARPQRCRRCWRCGRRSGASPIPPGRSAGCPRSSTATTARTSRATTSSRSPRTCAFS